MCDIFITPCEDGSLGEGMATVSRIQDGGGRKLEFEKVFNKGSATPPPKLIMDGQRVNE